MSTDAVQLFTALLALATLAASVVFWPLAMRARRGHDSEVVRAVVEYRSLICALIAGGSMAGSLYFSEVAHYVPCTLCWYQRIAMYSLAIIAITATIRRETPTPYFIVLASIGAIISLYHWLLERFPSIDTGACSSAVPCTLVWFEKFGFVTLPFMALVGFVAILTVCVAPPKEVA